MSDTVNVDRDERLAIVFDQLMQDSKRGSAQKRLDEAIRQHPDLATDLRELFATAQIADDIALLQSSDLDQLTGGGSKTSTIAGTRGAGSAIGTSIGEYEIREELGRGGMGVVYRAFQASLQRTVALKMIPNAAFAASQDLARLRAEALAAARLNHPNIVPVYEVGEQNSQPWFSMQFIEGTTLSQRLMSGPMKPRDAVALLIPIVEAIGSAHRAGVLHRDLKPSNILIDSNGTPYVTDFGLAKRVNVDEQSLASDTTGSDFSSLTLSGAILGTPAWMSPEQAAGQTDSINVATDIYSLGAVLFAMLTGRPPFQAASPLDTVLMVMEQDPPNIRMLNRAVDSDLEMVVMKCLQKPQDLRYASAGALASDLRAWLNNEPVSARSSTIAQVMTRLFRESHHAAILQNWGLLWMWHSLVVLLLCLTTNFMQFRGVTDRWPFVGLWVIGLGFWAAIFWNLRHRAGPITAVERQIAHVWGGSMIASSMLFWVESIMDRPVLEFSPVLGAIAGMVFLAKAGILSGSFYIQSAVMFATALVMAAIEHSDLPDFSVSLFGVMSALTFFLPGLKYYRQQRRSVR
ncbi:MAG: serine/threonine-protein kinase [Planctomycetaceae bacterium]